ncbi:hypothetical protein CP533_3310 [Ophiocordyceps camponoti-saundersi (nom. inval.)]|nr:hypothetical protein CP533_3310 [Ophiocordyceps camponoti-saundersi (nom. inval.)]
MSSSDTDDALDTVPLFIHVYDSTTNTLKVVFQDCAEPRIIHKFSHQPAATPPTEIATATATPNSKEVETQQLNKVTGFLALPGSLRKTSILAWAQSGYKAGPQTHLASSGSGTLSNSLWSKRVVRVADLLGVKIGNPNDSASRPLNSLGDDEAEAIRGRYLAAHVEPKLAVHALYVLLKDFLPKGRGRISLSHLRVLRNARWEDGSKPRFQIVISRGACIWCRRFVRTLANVSGIDLTIVVGQRLTKVEYASSTRSRDNSTPYTPRKAKEKVEPKGILPKPLPATPELEAPAWMKK